MKVGADDNIAYERAGTALLQAPGSVRSEGEILAGFVTCGEKDR